MIYEHRQYVIRNGQMKKLHDVFEKKIIPLFDKSGIKTVALWEPEGNDERAFMYLLKFESSEARNKAWEKFLNDPGWLKIKSELGETPPWEKTQSTLLMPTNYSPLP